MNAESKQTLETCGICWSYSACKWLNALLIPPHPQNKSRAHKSCWLAVRDWCTAGWRKTLKAHYLVIARQVALEKRPVVVATQ